MQLGRQGGGRDRDAQLRAGQRADGQRLPRHPHRDVREQCAEPEQQPEQDQRRLLGQIADVQRGAEPDEEQRAEEALGEREQLLGQPARLPDGRDDEAEARSPPA